MIYLNEEEIYIYGKFTTCGNYRKTRCDDDTNEVQSRRFEREGQERGFVTYDPATQTFELEELATHQKFDFDDIDLAAMEIYDLLND